MAAARFSVGDAGDQQVLPDREPEIAVAKVLRDGGKTAHLRNRHASDRKGDADPVQPGLLLRMNADMGGAVERRARRQRTRHGAVEFVTELLLEQAEKFLDAQGIEHIFQPRFGAVGAVAVLDEQAHHRIGHLAGVGRPSPARRCREQNRGGR